MKLGDVTLPIKIYSFDDEITLPPRSEIFRTIEIKADKYQIFIEGTQLGDGIFTANTIAHNAKAKIFMINTT